MPFCSILQCKNDSSRRNHQNGGVSYHRFPKDPYMKEKWIDATGRNNWMPSKFSTICSEHFLEEDFLTSNKGYRLIKSTALPSIKIVKFYDQIENFNATTGSSKMQSDSENCDLSQPKQNPLQKDFPTHKIELNSIKKEVDIIPGQFHFVDFSVQIKEEPIENTDKTVCLNCSTQTIKKLKGQLRFYKDKTLKQILKIRRLQSRNRRLIMKINNIYGQGKLGLPHKD